MKALCRDDTGLFYFFKMILTGISDNHGNYDYRNVYSNVDVLVHSGDLFGDDMWQGERELVEIFSKLKHTFPNAIIIVVPGNHDYYLENLIHYPDKVKSLFGDDLVILVDQEFTYEGIKFYGNPHTPLSMAFQRRNNFNDIDMIPGGLDVLITHEAPRCLDLEFIKNYKGSTEAGSLDLYNKVLEVKPRYHFFGHIHEFEHKKVGEITFCNNSQTYAGTQFKPDIRLLVL